MKNNKVIIVLITLLSLVAISLIIIMVFLLKNKVTFFDFGYRISNELVIDEVYEMNFNELSISSNASEIEVKTSMDDKIRVLVYGNQKDFTVTDDNNQLLIDGKENNCFVFCFRRTISKVEVYLPQDYAYKIDIKNKYGDIKVNRFMRADISIEENCGNVFVSGANAVVINNDYGDIVLDEAKDAKIEESAGDVKIGIVDILVVSNNLGDISVDKVNQYLDISDDCGDIEIDNVYVTKDSYIKNNLGDIKVNNTNDIYIDATTNLGSVKIDSENKHSNVTLEITNDCGDIIVKN